MKLILNLLIFFVFLQFVNAAQQQYQYGINGGYYGWSGEKQNQLYVEAGIQSARMLFPYSFFEQWGMRILIDNHSFNKSLGMTDYVAFLTYNQSAGVYTLPTSLYEPIWSNGQVNKNNLWAVFINQSVSTYKDYITLLEIWNEPDFINDWRYSLTWWNSPPTAQQLVRFGGDIYTYIRLLRITYEVTKRVAPSIYVTVGGLGYPQFLDAVLRYTDNSADGLTGINYIDAMSTHFYPYLATSKTDSDSYVMAYTEHINAFKNVSKTRGFKPKYWVVTETGVSTKPFDNYYGSEVLQRNYFMKLPSISIINGVTQNHVFVTGDTDNEWFGLFYNFIGKDSAKMKDSAKAVRFWKQNMSNRVRSDSQSNLLVSQLPSNVVGHAYVSLTNSTDFVYIIWANSSTYKYDEDTPSVKVTLKSSGEYKLIDYTGAYFKLAPFSNNSVTFTVDSTPILCYDTFSTHNEDPVNSSSKLYTIFTISLIVLLLTINLLFNF
ncbi:hypothetical protein PPL_03480 [Heterostelium album PN500]|uniref:Glycoside hydrolase family 5 domain-containing protein n=1 Tax=Heterostelium pallidum (strain ATCC 26659 / Pp 5 / PN500) TaxID=670386 RepID=D3B504_HETP5|nr:hypothetical protein PPL_03480 [Heterostelium album PN500]EFA84402.1 hypothetical protein PPL_03480 [Heterostelium album PN500]|eukprot:XP_020436516.1 hypothetical protein PPL_03480 [Heterostelium album PN500]